MLLEVKITRRETIKPSSPTPPQLRTFKLSLLDQLCPIVYTPIVLFYPMSDTDGHLDIEKKSSLLKDSLSETLTHFYPLAGRFKDNLFVDCNDEGVLYSEARVSFRLSDFLKAPQIELLDHFLPLRVICTNPAEVAVQIAIQINVFACGGIAIGASLSHKIIDGTTMSAFLKTWGAVARKLFDKAVYADFETASSLFPQRELLPTHSSMWLGSPFIKEVKSSARRFVFDAKAISALKAKARSKSVPNPTCVEALSGFIWKASMEASRAISGSIQPSVVAHAVNLRRRMKPTLSEYSMGNIVWKAFACYNANESEIELHGLVNRLRNSLVKIDSKYIENMLGDEGFSAISEWLEQVGELYSEGKPESYAFTSWCKMGLNEVDFGWGKPIWVSTGCVANATFKNVVLLLETTGGDGIEAWVILDEQEMSILEHDPEFLKFASVNPSVSMS